MLPLPARPTFGFEEYLDLEATSTARHEFLEGHVWAMAGGSPDHAAMAANVSLQLGAQLRGRPCRIFDANLRVKAAGLATYPDVTVICGRFEADPADARGHTAQNPIVVVEILSPSTEAYDREEKVPRYQRIPSLREIVLVAHDRREIEVWRRDGAGSCVRQVATAGAISLEAIDCALVVDEVYANPLAG